MRFDDRLLTVLNQPAGDRHDVAVRWRQLVDLVARAGSNAASPAVIKALESIRSEAPKVEENLRAAAARAVAALPLPLGLLQYFASDRLAVSAPVLAAATLESAQWRAILSTSDEETRRFIETLHPEIAADPPLDLTDSLVEHKLDEPRAAAAAPSLHEVVERIERRRRSRSAMKRNTGSGPEGSTSLFRWECGPGGEIGWVDGAPRGAVIGRSIARAQEGDCLDPDVVRAFTIRAPFRDAALSVGGNGPVSGEWKISGVPAFEPCDGRFAGYRGIALREEAEAPASDQRPALLSDPDALRELVHEIKTPLNAIIGFAEIIEGQYLGPAEQGYRHRAQEIVGQARLLLTAIDDLDFAAQVHSSSSGKQRTKLTELVERVTPSVRELAAGRGVDVEESRTVGEIIVAIESALAERLILRMSSAVIEQAEAGERLRITIGNAARRSNVSISRPARLADISEEQLLGGDLDLDHGFSFRLIRGLAQLAGAELLAPQGSISLSFPRV